MSDAATTLVPLLDALASPERDAVVSQFAKVTRERDEYKKLAALLQEANEKLKRGLVGQSAERLPSNDAQLSLAVLRLALGLKDDEAETEPPPEDEQTIPEHTRRKPARKPLPDSLPRVTIELLPDEVKREGLDAFERIGEDAREVLERRPASTVAVRLVYPKFVRKSGAADAPVSVLVAEPPELPIPRGTAGPAMLADTLVRRWADHQPLNRLEGIYARDGLELSKSTLCTWHDQLRELAAPLVDAMFTDAKSAPYLCVDATGVLVQAPERCKHGHFWVMVAPEKHVLYKFSRRHNSDAVDALLAGYAGHLVADAHAVYDHLYATGAVVEVGCWCHCRRYFFKSLESDPERAKAALVKIGALFKLERAHADAPRKEREAVRRLKSKPIVDEFFEWCDAEAELVLDESPMAKAFGYALNQELALRRFLDDGRLPLHNNISELNLRREVIGRRNWLFVGSEDGANANTTFVSLIASCRMLGLEPYAYLRDLLCLLPSWPKHRLLELAPAYWKKTLEHGDAQQRLDANVFRRVALGLLTP
ncbi:MAG: IS66 family transposase [Actinobacteria bacterium]|nr:IS66 family transposase [Actinomycetota bacterium]